MSNVTPIRPDLVYTREDQLTLAGYLMCQAIQAAILLIEDANEPRLAMEVLRLGRDRWDSVYRVQP